MKELETKATPLYISSGTSKDITVPYSLISFGVSTFTANFKTEKLWNGITYLISISNSDASIKFTLDGVALFNNKSFSKGAYKIVNLNGNWVYTQISSEPFKNS